MGKYFIILVFTPFIISSYAAAKQDAVKLTLCAEGKVSAVQSSDVFKLESGETIRLMMVQVPHIPGGSETGKPWPMSEQIHTAMKKKVAGKVFSFHCLKRDQNRHGELVAMVKMQNGMWLQSMMIKSGWARVYSTSDFSYAAEEFYALEDKARTDNKGLWSYDSYKVRGVTELNNNTGRFEIVEGMVLKVAATKKATYMNFGDDRRTDFTLKMDWRARRLFKKAGIDPTSYAGKHIQVRGWVSWNGGPMIDLSHPPQIRLLGESGQ